MRQSRASVRVLVALVLVAAGAACGVTAQEASRKVLYSLEPGETILQPESFIALTLDAADVVLVTTKGKAGPFFAVRDGARKGPFTKLDEAMKAAYAGREASQGRGRDCAVYEPDEGGAAGQFTGGEDRNGQTLEFKGATFGPHTIIFSRKATPDGAVAYVTAADSDKFWFESSDGRKVSFGGTPGDFRFSPDGKNAAVEVQGSLGMNQMQNLSKLPPDKMAAALQDMEKKYLYTIDGKMYGPFDSIDGFWFPRTSNDLYFRVQGKLYRNGAVVAGMGSFDRCDFYPSPDGRSYALAGYDVMKFSDGKQYPAPLDLVVVPDKGKVVFKWVALEKDKDLVVYQRTM